MRRRLAVRLVATITAVLALTGGSAVEAGVEVTIDSQTLEKLLKAVVPPTVDVPLPGGTPLGLGLRNLRVTGFDPAAGRGHVLTALDVDVPALGLHFPLEPRVSLAVATEGGMQVCYLSFERMEIRLPVAGAIDVSRLVPKVRIPADGSWLLHLSDEDVGVRSRLVDTRMGVQALRLSFEVDVK